MATPPEQNHAFRFFDNREKYLLFVNTCDEKQVIANRIGMEIKYLEPKPHALRVFDAGMGDGTVLTRIMRLLHYRFPSMPLLAVGKEISHEDVRICLEKMPDRLQEHPQTVLVVTNLFYSEAPWLYPKSAAAQAKLRWLTLPLSGTSAFEFEGQLRELNHLLREWWRAETSPKTGNPIYVTPSVMVIYRQDQEKALASVIPAQGDLNHEYDLILASQPFRARLPAEAKTKTVLAPLARSLAPDGLLVTVQSTGKDPGMEIIRGVWPGEQPFRSPRQELIRALQSQLETDRPDLRCVSYMDSRAEFQFSLQLPPDELSSTIGTSALLAAWNAAIYVAQMDDERLVQAMTHGKYLEVTRDVLKKYNSLWFRDESFLVTRVSDRSKG